MTQLIDEMLALEMPWGAARALLEAGVPRGFVAEMNMAGDLAVAGCEIDRGGRFSFGGATRRLIVGVRRGGELIDLVALSSSCEDEWALRIGMADFLGEDLLLDAVLAERRELRLFATPMAWLRAGGRGVCVLDWTPAALVALRGLGAAITLVVDPGSKAKLQGLLTHGGLPLVAEDRTMRRAA